MHVCVYYVCVSVLCVRLCVYVCASACMRLSACVRVSVCVCASVCMCVKESASDLCVIYTQGLMKVAMHKQPAE